MLTLLSCSPLFVLAATSTFEVTVQPNPVKVSEFSDVTIKAVDENGNVNQAADHDIWIEVEGHDYTDPDITLPGGGIGFFEPSAQGILKLSKGLSFKKAGTYKLTATDVYSSNLKGTVTIQVLANSSGPAIGNLSVSSPTSWSIEEEDTVNIIWNTTYANTPIVIMIDEVQAQEWLSDQRGDFQVQVSWLEAWSHELVVNALDLDDKVVATSWPIPFTYQPNPDQLLLAVEVLPGKEVPIRTKITFTIKTDETVTSAMLKFGDGEFVPTTRQSAGVFTKEVTFDEIATYPIDVKLAVNQNSFSFEDVETIKIIDELRKITSLTATPNIERNTVNLKWTYIGKVDYFRIKYGTSQTDLRLGITSSKPEATLLLADPTVAYYAQVFPVDEQGVINGEASDIITILPIKKPAICGNGIVEEGEACDDNNLRPEDGCSTKCEIEIKKPEHNGAEAVVEPTCYTDGIPLSSMKIGERYYITRWPVPDAKEYIIYRADTQVVAIDQMSIITKTTDTKYEYPFDVSAKTDQYARYAVKAVCENDDLKPIGDMTQVKVGPEYTLIILILWSLFAFGLVRFVKAS